MTFNLGDIKIDKNFVKTDDGIGSFSDNETRYVDEYFPLYIHFNRPRRL